MQSVTSLQSESLVEAARQAMHNAYAPYSKFRVGAAVMLDDGRIFSGCNIENVSYGLTNCAERTAVFRAIAETPGGIIRLLAVAIDNVDAAHCSPCGACRQVIAEFASRDTDIFYRGPQGMVSAKMAELLPDGFRF